MATGPDHTFGNRICPKGEVLASASGQKVSSQRASPFRPLEHESAVPIRPVLLLRLIIGCNKVPSGLGQATAQHIEPLRQIPLPVYRWMSSTWDPGEDLLRSCFHVLALPTSREVAVPIYRVGFPPQPSVDSGAAAEDTAGHLIDISARDANRVGPNLVAETWDVEAREVCASEPGWFHGAAPTTAGRVTLLNEEDGVACFAEAVGNGHTSSAGADDDVVVGLVGGELGAGR